MTIIQQNQNNTRKKCTNANSQKYNKNKEMETEANDTSDKKPLQNDSNKRKKNPDLEDKALFLEGASI
jgi:hypothetical protein